MINIATECPICDITLEFSSEDGFWSCRDGLISASCPFGACVVRERALAKVLFGFYTKDEIANLAIHEPAPSGRGLAILLGVLSPKNYVRSGYWPGKPFGEVFDGIRNEDLENQTFKDSSFDIVIHLDILEHLFDPWGALREICRTLKPHGKCLFTVPTEHNRMKTEQVAFRLPDGNIQIIGDPEYHGNPQRPQDRSLVTWRYGYDLPFRICEETGFDVEVRRFQSKRGAVIGYMNEVYILEKFE